MPLLEAVVEEVRGGGSIRGQDRLNIRIFSWVSYHISDIRVQGQHEKWDYERRGCKLSKIADRANGRCNKGNFRERRRAMIREASTECVSV